MWVSIILHTPMYARDGRLATLQDSDGAPLTLRKFLWWMYKGKRLPRRGRYTTAITDVRDAINSTELPFEYPAGSGNLWAEPVVTLPRPLTTPGLDDPWPVRVRFPPGDGTGPKIDYGRLRAWYDDVVCFRALINLHYRWHIEGLRLMPVRGGKHWIYRRDPKLYDLPTDVEKDAICFPTGTGAKRRDQRIADADAAFDRLVKAGDAMFIEGRLLPPPQMAHAGTWMAHAGS